MVRMLLNTAGEPEREARSRRWNALEALGVASATLFFAWPVAYGWGVLGGNDLVRDAAVVPLYGILIFGLCVSPFLHRDTVESWGLGSPQRLWALLRGGPMGRRLCVGAAAASLFGGLLWLTFDQWPRLVKPLPLPRAAIHWTETLPGCVAIFILGSLGALLIVTCAVRYDNFRPAFGAALKVSAGLVLFALAAGLTARGWEIFDRFDPRRYVLDVVGYFFWGCFQQLFFCAWFGTRLRKAFGPAAARPAPRPVGERAPWALGCGLAGAAVLAPAGWLAVRALHGAEAATLRLFLWLAVFTFPIGALWGWFFAVDRRRLLVATLSASFFGLIHLDSYGLVVVTWMLGVFLAWLFMSDRTRNMAALAFIHGFLGTTFGMWFSKKEAGILRVSYHVGPWNVKEAAPEVLIIPLLCLGAYIGLAVWCARRPKETPTPA